VTARKRRSRGIRAGVVLLATAAVLGSGCGSAAKAPPATTSAAPSPTIPRVPLRDRFTGTLHSGTGSWAGARDAVEVRLQAPGRTGTRRLTMWIVSTGCPAGATCVHLSGSLRGQLRPVRALPDVGHRYAIAASGSLGSVGVMTASGTVAGTGNINSGVESLELTLTGRHGSVRVSAHSSRVPAFTSP
jgi:hypothetical protein